MLENENNNTNLKVLILPERAINQINEIMYFYKSNKNISKTELNNLEELEKMLGYAINYDEINR